MRVSLTLLFVGLPWVLAGPAFSDCEPDGDVQFICGPVSPEDLMIVPETPWVVVSSMDDEGRLHLADTRDHSTRPAFPLSTSVPRLDGAVFAACPGPVEGGFRPHGLSLRPGAEGRHTLYVVRHGAREAVEVFEVDASGAEPSLTWVGCVVAPQGVGLNSVAYLPDGGFAVTNFQMAAGQIWEWQPDAGWSETPGTETAGPNGLEASEDGQWLYIGGWGTESLIRVSRGRTPVQRESVAVGFHIDNVRRATDGSLLAAGHAAESVGAIVACLNTKQCDGVTSHVARVDPGSLEATTVVSYASNEHVILGTVGLLVGDEIWLGQVGGGTRIARFPDPD